MISNYVVLFRLSATRDVLVFFLQQTKFLVNRSYVAGIANNEVAAASFLRIFDVIRVTKNGLRDCSPFINMKRFYSRRGYYNQSFLK
jgi:hypothetical protein